MVAGFVHSDSCGGSSREAFIEIPPHSLRDAPQRCTRRSRNSRAGTAKRSKARCRCNAASPPAYPAPTNLKVLPKNLTGQQVHDIMKQWNGELGVRCGACHAEDPASSQQTVQRAPHWQRIPRH